MEEQQQPGIFRRHRYPTRFSLRKCITSSSQSQVLGVKSKAHDQGLGACRKSMKRAHIINSTPYLCIDIIFRILLLLPATVLNEVMRYVCKTWNSIVSDPLFINAHANLQLQASTSVSPGMIVQDPTELDRAFYLQTSSSSDGLFKLRVTELEIPFPAALLGSCNGLVLLQDSCSEKLHLMNMVTGVIISTLPRARRLGHYDARRRVCLAYSASSGRYKVLLVAGTRNNKKFQVHVCTVGVDTRWRLIKTVSGEEKATFCSRSHFIKGFVYWFDPRRNPLCFALDVETETMYHCSAPKDLKDIFEKSCVNMETGIGLVHECLPDNWEIWELIDPRSGKWVKVMEMELENLRNRLMQAHRSPCGGGPVFVLKNGHVYIFERVTIVYQKKHHYVLMCYDMTTGRLSDALPITWTRAEVIPYLHVNTLLPPNIS